MDQTQNPEVQAQSVQPVAPRSLITVGDLFKKSFDVYSTGFWRLMGMSALPILGYALVALVIGVYFASQFIVGFGSTSSGIINIVLSLLGVAAVIFAILFAVLAQVALIMMIDKGAANLNIRTALSQARPRMWSYLGANILVTLIVIGCLILLIIPGIYIGVALSMVSFVIVLEGKRIKESLSRSRNLIKNYWWPVFGRLLLLMLVAFILSGIAYPFDKAIDETGDTSIVNQILTLIATPFMVTYSYQLYKSLVSIKS